MNACLARAVVVVVVVVVALAGGCPARQATPAQRRTITFRGEAVATVAESVDRNHVVRETAFDGDTIVLDATLDDAGFATGAIVTRKRGARVVRALRLVDGKVAPVDDTAAAHALVLPPRPVVLLELVHRLRVTRPTDAVVVDLGAGEFLPIRVERRGPEFVVVDDRGAVVVRALPEGDRTGPGAFAEGDAPPSLPSPPVELAVPGTPTLRGLALPRATKIVSPPPEATSKAPALFLESDAIDVVDFAKPRCGGEPLEVARRIAEAVHPLVDACKSDEPPSASAMLHHGGDCDGAAALVTAALRACGVPARPVVGYRLVDAGSARARLVPHAVSEVYTSTGWMRVDATMPALGVLDDVFVPVAAGLGGALSMGRVLGVLDGGDLVAAPAVPSATTAPPMNGAR